MNTLSRLIRILSAATWHLSAIRSRWQTEADHAAAERRMGELLRETERAKGAKGNPGGRGAKIVQSPDVTAQPTLAELGITKNESSMGELLRETERNKGAKGSVVTGNVRVPVKDDTAPTLAELGITKNESSMGELLRETERAKPPGDNQHKKQDRSQHVTEAPTLASLGITKPESSKAQKLAALQCPRCFAEFGAPPGWPPAICPSCKLATLKPQTCSHHG